MQRILIIQDYADYRCNLIEYFESLGYFVFSHSNCKSALGLIDQYEFDIIICDLDYEYNTDFKNFISFLNLEVLQKSYVILISSRFKSVSDFTPFNIKNQSFYIINGRRMNDIASLIDRQLLSKSE